MVRLLRSVSCRTPQETIAVLIEQVPMLDGTPLHSGFSSVFRVKRSHDDSNALAGYIAVKCLSPHVHRPPHDHRQEVALLKRLSHAHLIRLLALVDDRKNAEWQLEMPYYPLPLNELLRNRRFKPSLEDSFDNMCCSIIRQTAEAVAYLHAEGIGHRDIKPDNLLLGPTGHLVLIDLGIAFDMHSTSRSESPGQMIFDVGTGSYKAPEVLFGSRDYDARQLDLWAMGVTFAELFCPLVEIDEGAGEDDWRFEDDYAPPSNLPSFMRREVWRRTPLFGTYVGDLALISRIFKSRGTPDKQSWPEAATLPDFDKVAFKALPRQPLAESLPNLSATPRRDKILDLLDGLLTYQSTERTSAAAVIGLEWLGVNEEVVNVQGSFQSYMPPTANAMH